MLAAWTSFVQLLHPVPPWKRRCRAWRPDMLWKCVWLKPCGNTRWVMSSWRYSNAWLYSSKELDLLKGRQERLHYLPYMCWVETSVLCCQETKLIKAMQPFEKWSVDFKGLLTTSSRNKYFFTVIDEFSRFPFAFASPDMNSTVVIRCLDQLFSLRVMPGYIHSDNRTSFSSSDSRNISQSGALQLANHHPVACRGLVMPGATTWLDAPRPNSSFDQWRMVVIVTGYTLFVTSQYDVMFTFANQCFGEVCWHKVHI